MVEFVLFYNGHPLIRSPDRLVIERHRDLLVSDWKWEDNLLSVKQSFSKEYKYAD